jgi:hypothetical protein
MIVFEIDSKHPKFLPAEFVSRKLYENKMRIIIGDIKNIKDEAPMLAS